MAFTATALQLVNRVRRRRRLDDVASISKVEDLAALDSINNAMEEVLSSDRWEFDLRRAQMTLRGRLTGCVATNSPSVLSSFVIVRSDGLEIADLVGDYVTRLLVTGSTEYSQTAFRINYSAAILGGVSAAVSCATDADETISAAEAEIFQAEYILPDTVRDIVRVTYQQETLALEQIDPVVEFDELYPSPSIEYGPPQSVSVGGLDVGTYLSTGSADDAALRMVVWPVPDDSYVLDYTYYYRHPELTTATDTLDGVPPNIVAKIVDLAATQMKTFYEKDYGALALSAETRRSIGEMHRRSKGQSADRKIIGNWEGSGSRHIGHSSIVGGRLIGGS